MAEKQALEQFGHGGDLTTAAELYGIRQEELLDFSANMNPLGPPASVTAVIQQYTDLIRHYPDPAARVLTGKLADCHQVPASSILTGNGAAELIDLAFRVLKPRITVLAVPCFGEYADAARKAGSELVHIELQRKDAFKLRLEQLETAQEKLRSRNVRPGEALWCFGSPNNPTGQLVDPSLIRHLLQAGECVMADEAFMEFIAESGEWSLLSEAAQNKSLIVTRSLTKFYSIPGIRLGYMAAHPERIAQLRDLQIPWSVNSLAQAIGTAVLDDRDYERETIAWLKRERTRLDDSLSSLGLTVYPGAANYILFSLPPEYNMTAGQLQHALGKRGVLIRDASLFEGLDAYFCRVAVRREADNRRLIEVLRAVFATISPGAPEPGSAGKRKAGGGE